MGASPSSAPGTKQVIHIPNIIKVDRDRVFVNPPAPHLGGAVLVQWANHTGKAARLWFPQGGDIFEALDSSGSTVDFLSPIVIQAGNASPELVVKATPKPGRYRYSVFCEAVSEFAQGNSEPEVDVP